MEENSESCPLYMDHVQTFEKRVDDLVSRLTVEEKISQLTLVSRASLIFFVLDSFIYKVLFSLLKILIKKNIFYTTNPSY